MIGSPSWCRRTSSTGTPAATSDASTEPAVTATFRGRTVAKTGPWGQGPALLQVLTMLDPLPDEQLDPSTALGAHTVVEALKLALADREAYYGDGADVPLDALLSPAYAARRRALIGDRASLELRPGAVGAGLTALTGLEIDQQAAGDQVRVGGKVGAAVERHPGGHRPGR